MSVDFKTLLQIFYMKFSFVNLQKKNKQFFFSIVSLSSAVKQFQQLYI